MLEIHPSGILLNLSELSNQFSCPDSYSHNFDILLPAPHSFWSYLINVLSSRFLLGTVLFSVQLSQDRSIICNLTEHLETKFNLIGTNCSLCLGAIKVLRNEMGGLRVNGSELRMRESTNVYGQTLMALLPTTCAMRPQNIIPGEKVPPKCNSECKSAFVPQAALCPFFIFQNN